MRVAFKYYSHSDGFVVVRKDPGGSVLSALPATSCEPRTRKCAVFGPDIPECLELAELTKVPLSTVR
jgi:hypothetical protein